MRLRSAVQRPDRVRFRACTRGGGWTSVRRRRGFGGDRQRPLSCRSRVEQLVEIVGDRGVRDPGQPDRQVHDLLHEPPPGVPQVAEADRVVHGALLDRRMRGLQVGGDGGRVEGQYEVARSERLGEEEVDGLDRVRDDGRAAPVQVVHEDVERRVLGGQVNEFPDVVLEQVKVASAASVKRVGRVGPGFTGQDASRRRPGDGGRVEPGREALHAGVDHAADHGERDEERRHRDPDDVAELVAVDQRGDGPDDRGDRSERRDGDHGEAADATRTRAGQDLPPHRLGSSALEVEVEEQPPPLPLREARHD